VKPAIASTDVLTSAKRAEIESRYQVDTERVLRASWSVPLAFITGLAMLIALVFGTISSLTPPPQVPPDPAVTELKLMRKAAASLVIDGVIAERAAAFRLLMQAEGGGRASQIRTVAAAIANPAAVVAGASVRPAGPWTAMQADWAKLATLTAAAPAIVLVNGETHLALSAEMSRVRPRKDAPLRGRLPTARFVTLMPLKSADIASSPGSTTVTTLDIDAELKRRTGIQVPEIPGVEEVRPASWSQRLTALWESNGPMLGALLLGLAGACLQLVYSRRQTALSKDVVAAIENRALDRAMRDPLTGLRNRSGFKLRLDEAAAKRGEGEALGVIYIDLDRFKEVNDSYGHDMGDKLLIAVTKRLGAMCLRDETLARLGGDEFAMIVQGHESAEDIAAFGTAISMELGIPFNLDGTQVNIGGSVGVAVAPEDGVEPAELVRRADISMYRSKAAGRGQSHRFHASMEDEVRRRTFLESELRKAIERDEMDVFYQPVMGSDGESFIGVEALLRWHHHAEGMISPAVFVPLAEQSGLIRPISEWMMRRAMTDILPLEGISLALNVSPAQFKQENLVQSVVEIATECGMDIDRLEMEVTEGVLVDDADNAVTIIEDFRKAGFKVALDDFGTGYASLSYLKRFRFDKLKIDQVFVRNLSIGSGAGAIVHAVVALGRALGLTVQAEGVESLEHHIFLRAAGCHSLQGYYFAKPMPTKDIIAYAAKHRTPALRHMRWG
jgi:diguanylate cyclase (GGDEF)-like protein